MLTPGGRSRVAKFRHQREGSRTVSIGSFATRTEAEIVVGLLDSAGIAASIRADDAGGASPFDFSGGAHVLVDESDAEAASQLVADGTGETQSGEGADQGP